MMHLLVSHSSCRARPAPRLMRNVRLLRRVVATQPMGGDSRRKANASSRKAANDDGHRTHYAALACIITCHVEYTVYPEEIYTCFECGCGESADPPPGCDCMKPNPRRETRAASSQAYSAFFFTGRLQPLRACCGTRLKVSSPAGASLLMVEPAPMVAPAPTVTGAINCVSAPKKASSSMTVWNLLAPCSSSASTVPGRMRAKGPMREPAPIIASSITELACMFTPSAIVTSRK